MWSFHNICDCEFIGDYLLNLAVLTCSYYLNSLDYCVLGSLLCRNCIQMVGLMLLPFQDSNATNSRKLDQQMIGGSNSLDGIKSWLTDDHIVNKRTVYNQKLDRLDVLTRCVSKFDK